MKKKVWNFTILIGLALSHKQRIKNEKEKATGRKYPWGNHGPHYKGEYYANYNTGNYNDDGFIHATPVGSFPKGASPYGLMDMAGNVWEWCSDWYDENYYKDSPQNNSGGPKRGTYRVLRGDGWISSSRGMRCTDRGSDTSSTRHIGWGFRFCLEN